MKLHNAALAVAAVLATSLLSMSTVSALTSPCGQTTSRPPTITHTIVVMLENRSYSQVVKNAAAPYQTQLASQCGNSTSAFGATHTSAVNYLATSAGQYPSTSLNGCNYAACVSNQNNIYQQLDAAKLTWRAYEESMPYACDKTSAVPYKIGHNPAIFYSGITSTACKANDVGVGDLTATAGQFWTDLQTANLPTVAWVTPNTDNDGEKACGGACALSAADTWLQRFMTNVIAAPQYQNGTTLVLITYDEGTGADTKVGEDCTNPTLDLAGAQPSCQVPLFVVWPYTAAGNNQTFFTHYSITRTIDELFSLPCLAHGCDTQTNSLIGHGFGF